MKNHTIRDRYAALTALAMRSLPSSTAINKVTALLTSRFKPANDVIERRIRDVLAQHPLEDGDPSTVLPIAVQEARTHAISAVLDEAQPIRKIPQHLRLTAADLPKALAGAEGWKNADELSSIRVALGGLYLLTGDELTIDDESGEELDDTAAAE